MNEYQMELNIKLYLDADEAKINYFLSSSLRRPYQAFKGFRFGYFQINSEPPSTFTNAEVVENFD